MENLDTSAKLTLQNISRTEWLVCFEASFEPEEKLSVSMRVEKPLGDALTVQQAQLSCLRKLQHYLQQLGA